MSTEPAKRDQGIVDHTYPPIVSLIRASFVGLRLQIEVTGSEHIPREGGAVLAANHIGFMDFTFIGAAARERNRLVRFYVRV